MGIFFNHNIKMALNLRFIVSEMANGMRKCPPQVDSSALRSSYQPISRGRPSSRVMEVS